MSRIYTGDDARIWRELIEETPEVLKPIRWFDKVDLGKWVIGGIILFWGVVISFLLLT